MSNTENIDMERTMDDPSRILQKNPVSHDKDSVPTRIPRKQYRQQKKKLRKKTKRRALALERCREEMNNEMVDVEMNEVEDPETEKQRLLWEARERQYEEENATRRKKEEEETRRREEEMKRRGEEKRRKEIIQKNLKKLVASGQKAAVNPSQQKSSVQTSEKPETIFNGNESAENKAAKDTVDCSFYLRTGACRYGNRCGRQHPYPSLSPTILVKNMYEGMPIDLADEGADDNLEYDEVEAERHYAEFFHDVHPEFLKYGTIVQFKVCKNPIPHLRGNVYVQYSNRDEAQRAFARLNGRWYAGKQLVCEYSPVVVWESAICQLFVQNRCPKGKHCCFLHVYENPGGLYRQTNAVADSADVDAPSASSAAHTPSSTPRSNLGPTRRHSQEHQSQERGAHRTNDSSSIRHRSHGSRRKRSRSRTASPDRCRHRRRSESQQVDRHSESRLRSKWDSRANNTLKRRSRSPIYSPPSPTRAPSDNNGMGVDSDRNALVE